MRRSPARLGRSSGPAASFGPAAHRNAAPEGTTPGVSVGSQFGGVRPRPGVAAVAKPARQRTREHSRTRESRTGKRPGFEPPASAALTSANARWPLPESPSACTWVRDRSDLGRAWHMGLDPLRAAAAPRRRPVRSFKFRSLARSRIFAEPARAGEHLPPLIGSPALPRAASGPAADRSSRYIFPATTSYPVAILSWWWA